MRYQTHLIKPPRPSDDHVRYPDGITKDIIETVLFGDVKAAWYTTDFAKTLKGKTLLETCRNIWTFVKNEIPYVLDPMGEQMIKSPGRLWQEKSGDCKSFSLFTASICRNLGIDFGYRFASYDAVDETPTHVYVYVPIGGGKEIILDSVWTGPFNTQKQYTFKIDKPMTRIKYLGAIGAAKPKHVPTELRFDKPIDQVTDGEMTLLVARQRLEIEKQNSAAVGGAFNFQQPNYDKAIGVINHALSNIDNPDAIIAMAERMEANAIANGRQPHVGGFLKKIGQGIKKAVKAVTKVVTKVATAPARLVVKGLLELYLPKAAPAFLYLFAEENVLPDKMKAKRKKMEKFKNFIVDKIGMKNDHFMGIIRNALTKKYGKSPEVYLAEIIKGAAIKGIGNSKAAWERVNQQRRVNGIGVIPAVIAAVFSAIKWIISKLGGKKAGVDLTEQDMPDPEGDAANAINNELKQSLTNLAEAGIQKLSETATTLISTNASYPQTMQTIQSQFPNLQQPQQTAIVQDIQRGFTPISEEEGMEVAQKVRRRKPIDPENAEESFKASGGRSAPGMCNC